MRTNILYMRTNPGGAPHGKSPSASGSGSAPGHVNCGHALDQSLSHRLRDLLVRRPVLPAAHLRESGAARPGRGRRARAPVADGPQAAALYHAAVGAAAGAGGLALARLRHWPRPGQRLDARQARSGAAGDRLPPWLRPAVAPTGRWPLPPQPGVAALVQRTAAAAADGGGAAGGAQAVLTPARMHQSSAGPLALSYAALIVFASLFPFEGWRAQGIDPLVFLLAALPPPYWTWFDVLTNAAGYAPLGFLLALGLLRTGSGRRAVLLATLAGALLSLAMEFLQIYLPRRVPSNLDLALNAAGALAGASIAALLERLGVLGRWHDWRDRWLLPDARGAMVLRALWPPALLFPAAVPFGLGQVQQRLETALIGWLAHTPSMPSMPLPDGLPLRQTALAPLSPGGELLCVALGLLAPCLLGYCVIRR